jgi:thymidylate synthase (FAD)
MAKFVSQSAKLLVCPTQTDALAFIERAGRTAYKSEPSGEPEKFVQMLIKRGHLSVLEHCSLSIAFCTDRGVTHELVRHRLASYTQESTRFCNYSANRFGNEVTFVLPVEFADEYNTPDEKFLCSAWVRAMTFAETVYLEMLENDASPQLARSVLPNSLKTDIVMTANFREWMHVFELRMSKAAHPQMRNLMQMAYETVSKELPVIFPPEKSTLSLERALKSEGVMP